MSVCRHAALGTMLLTCAAQATNLEFTPGEDPRFSWDSYTALQQIDLSGERLVISGPWTGKDLIFESVVDYFAAATGADVQYNGSSQFEQQIVIDTQAGSAPDIAIFPQPGLAADLAAKGLLVPLGDETREWITTNYAAGDSWVDLGTYPGADGRDDLYGFFYRVDLKSLVWYVPENFEDAGYEIPQTLDELKTLTQQIADEGETPWCIGLFGGATTGWPATDWVEELLLRTQPADVYDQWVRNEIPFTDPRFIEALEAYGWFARNEQFVEGGGTGVAAADWRDNVKGLFTSPAKCYMHRQASFIPDFFPDQVVQGEDVDFFYFPADDSKDLGQPVLGGGTVFGITRDSKAARAFIDFLKSPIAHEVWMAQSGFLTPHKGVNPAAYANDVLRKQGEILQQATTFRFDGSDLMPGKIGAGVFWRGMVDYTSGTPAKEVAKDIQSAWDALK